MCASHVVQTVPQRAGEDGGGFDVLAPVGQGGTLSAQWVSVSCSSHNVVAFPTLRNRQLTANAFLQNIGRTAPLADLLKTSKIEDPPSVLRDPREIVLVVVGTRVTQANLPYGVEAVLNDAQNVRNAAKTATDNKRWWTNRLVQTTKTLRTIKKILANPEANRGLITQEVLERIEEYGMRVWGGVSPYGGTREMYPPIGSYEMRDLLRQIRDGSATPGQIDLAHRDLTQSYEMLQKSARELRDKNGSLSPLAAGRKRLLNSYSWPWAPPQTTTEFIDKTGRNFETRRESGPPAAGDATLAVSTSITIDTPGKTAGGTLVVVKDPGSSTHAEYPIRFSSWSGSTFTLANIAEFACDSATTTTITESAKFTNTKRGDLVRNATRSAISWVKTVDSANTITIYPAITGQTNGDNIELNCVPVALDTGDDVYVPILYKMAAAAIEQAGLTYDDTIYYRVKVRNTRTTTEIKPFSVDGTCSGTDVSVPVVRTETRSSHKESS